MTSRPLRWLALSAALTLPLATAACGEEDVAKSSVAAWNKWSKSNPVPGTEIVSHTGDGNLKFTGRFRVNAKLTAKPSEESVKASIVGLCGFNKVSPAEVEYLLQVRKLTLKVPCEAEKDAKVVAFWKSVGPMPGLVKATLSDSSYEASVVDREALGKIGPDIIRAIAATGVVPSSRAVTVSSPDLKVTSDLNSGLTANLGALEKFLSLAAPKATGVKMTENTVVVETKGNPAEAATLQRRIIGGSPVGVSVNVFPAKTLDIERADVSTDAKALAEQLSNNSEVTGVFLSKSGWQVNTANVDAMRKTFVELAENKTAAGLGQLVMTSGNAGGCAFDYDPTTGKRQIPIAVMAICAMPDAVTVATGEVNEIRFRSDKVKDVVNAIHEMPPYSTFTLAVLGPKGFARDAVAFTTDRELDFVETGRGPLADKVRKLWGALPVQPQVERDERRSAAQSASAARRAAHAAQRAAGEARRAARR